MAMEQRELGNSGVKVSPIGLGTWPMSGQWWGASDDDESVRTIHRSLDLGVTLIDTAEGYGNGHAEEVVGRALKGRRNEAVIADKVSPGNLSPEAIRKAWEGSARRLGTDMIDVYFMHWPNIDLPVADAMGELEKLRSEGKIRAIGVSNFTAAEMEQAGQHGTVDVLQPPYNLFWRYIELDQLPYCREHNIGIMTYSSLAQGLLTGTLSRDTTFPEGDNRRATALFQPEMFERCLDAVARMQDVARRTGHSLAQLAIAWNITRPGITTSLLGARTTGEIEENAGGVGLSLPEDAAREIDRLGRDVFESLPDFPDMFGQWVKNDLQKRRYERQGRAVDTLPALKTS